MHKRSLLLLALALVLAGAAGCDLYRILGLPFGKRVPYAPSPSGDGVEVYRDIQFDDIPVPLSFTLRREDLFSYKGSRFRIGRFHYDGAWGLNKTWWFYFKQMPLQGWELVSETPRERTVELVYRKPGENCEILVDGTGDIIAVHVRVEPIRAGD